MIKLTSVLFAILTIMVSGGDDIQLSELEGFEFYNIAYVSEYGAEGININGEDGVYLDTEQVKEYGIEKGQTIKVVFTPETETEDELIESVEVIEGFVTDMYKVVEIEIHESYGTIYRCETLDGKYEVGVTQREIQTVLDVGDRIRTTSHEELGHFNLQLIDSNK